MRGCAALRAACEAKYHASSADVAGIATPATAIGQFGIAPRSTFETISRSRPSPCTRVISETGRSPGSSMPTISDETVPVARTVMLEGSERRMPSCSVISKLAVTGNRYALSICTANRARPRRSARFSRTATRIGRAPSLSGRKGDGRLG